MAEARPFEKLAMIGCGSMGGGMALLFAENGLHVSINDPSEAAIDKIQHQAEKEGFGDRLHKHTDYKSLCESLGSPKLIVFSLPHGDVGDIVLEGLMPYLQNDDIILDAGNEHFANTERRQGRTTTKGIHYVGCGVSGGYQAARRGPSMCPGSDVQALETLMPLLQTVAAKDKHGRACVGPAGFGGSGHYVKMIHNGIEHGMMCAISEAWQIMKVGLGMDSEHIAEVFDDWNAKGPLRGTFLVRISADICRAVDPSSGAFVLDTVLDKVVQDITGEEGTGVWSNMEAIRLHIPAPTLNVAHAFRLASAYRGTRERLERGAWGGFHTSCLDQPHQDFLALLQSAVYTACLASYAQGIDVIEAADRENKWCIDYAAVWQIWRAGCIIQSDHISEERLAPIFLNAKRAKLNVSLLSSSDVVEDLVSGYTALKEVNLACTKSNLVIPSLSATLEYVKYQSSTDLPASMYEAQLDYFGKHMYDKRGEDRPLPTEGLHHYEWKPA